MLTKSFSLSGPVKSVALLTDGSILVSAGDSVIIMFRMTPAEATELCDALTGALSVATPADVQATVTLSDAEEALARR